MAKPKIGDKLKWTRSDGQWASWEIISREPDEPPYKYAFRAKVIASSEDSEARFKIEQIVFKADTVEDSGWEYVETPFQQFIRETLETGAESA